MSHHSGKRAVGGFVAGGAIGALGGLIGLGGAEFRLPVLKGVFHLETLEAVIFNKAMSLIVVTVALIARSVTILSTELFEYWPIALNLLAGSLIGAWLAAGSAIRMNAKTLDYVVFSLLVGLAALMIVQHLANPGPTAEPMLDDGTVRWVAGFVAGLGIGAIAAFLGVAGGELLIPTITLLYGVDIRLAGSLSLAISLPTMLVGMLRYAGADAFTVLGRERSLFTGMGLGSAAGAVAGGLAIGLVAPDWLIVLLAGILLLSAWKAFGDARRN
ncbi:TSUP family transporter [Guyparkeria sp.]|uniref:TSUP family transporter n=1 Tax=Guyparkeria sp. TaxID=2035736 RepID=UPI0039708B1D